MTIAIATTGIALLAACQPAKPFSAPGRPGWKYVGGDEFNDGRIDTTKWKEYHNTYGDGNKELACLTPDNVAEVGGALVIVSERKTTTCPSGSVRKYTSGFVGSREVGRYYPMFGRFEIRARVPHAQGLWPAFWLRHRRGAPVAEVDVLEYFHSQRPGFGSAALHLDGRYNLLKKSVFFESPKATPAWHTWAVEISKVDTGIKFEYFMDEKSIGSYIDTQHKWADGTDPNATWDIALNQAVGGNWAGSPDGPLGYLDNLGRCAQGGTAPSGCVTTGINRIDWSKPVDAAYAIDYVRVYTR
ncbi:MAG: glycoside hydrolase family 16 protein [Acidimicrobiales bacterium]|nr:glycoside hydrolase family 16 protein [Acidimicrobiales bacterium]